MKHLLLIPFFYLCCTSNTLYAQQSPEDITLKFFDIYQKEDSDKGIDYLFSTNKYSADLTNSLTQVKSELRTVLSRMGSFYDHEILSRKTAGKSLVLYTCIVKHDRDALTFRILFYKPGNEWQVQTFKFDNNISEELEKSN